MQHHITCNAAHDIQTPRGSCHPYRCLQHSKRWCTMYTVTCRNGNPIGMPETLVGAWPCSLTQPHVGRDSASTSTPGLLMSQSKVSMPGSSAGEVARPYPVVEYVCSTAAVCLLVFCMCQCWLASCTCCSFADQLQKCNSIRELRSLIGALHT